MKSESVVRPGYKVLGIPKTKDTPMQEFNKALKGATKKPLTLLEFTTAQRNKLTKPQIALIGKVERVTTSFHKEMIKVASLIKANKKVVQEETTATVFRNFSTFVAAGAKSPKGSNKFLASLTSKNIKTVNNRITVLQEVLSGIDSRGARTLDKTIKVIEDVPERIQTLAARALLLQKHYESTLGGEQDKYKDSVRSQRAKEALIKENIIEIAKIFKGNEYIGTKAQRNAVVKARTLLKTKGPARTKAYIKAQESIEVVVSKLNVDKEDRADLKLIKGLAKFKPATITPTPVKEVAPVKPKFLFKDRLKDQPKKVQDFWESYGKINVAVAVEYLNFAQDIKTILAGEGSIKYTTDLPNNTPRFAYDRFGFPDGGTLYAFTNIQGANPNLLERKKHFEYSTGKENLVAYRDIKDALNMAVGNGALFRLNVVPSDILMDTSILPYALMGKLDNAVVLKKSEYTVSTEAISVKGRFVEEEVNAFSEITFDQLNAIGVWQNLGAATFAGLNNTIKLPPFQKFQHTSAKYLYRFAIVEEHSLEDIDADLPLETTAKSWTKGLDSATEYKKYALRYTSVIPKGSVGVIVKVSVDELDVVFDIEALWEDEDFNAIVNKFEEEGKFFNEGMEFKGTQNEVVAKNAVVRVSDIVSVTTRDNKVITLEQYKEIGPSVDVVDEDLFWYGLRARPYSPSAQPTGVAKTIPLDLVRSTIKGAHVMDAHNYRYGAIGYKQALSEKQIYNFELVDFAKFIWDDKAIRGRVEQLEEIIKESKENEFSFAEFYSDYILPRGVMVRENPFYFAGDYRKSELRSAVDDIYGGKDIRESMLRMWEAVNGISAPKEPEVVEPVVPNRYGKILDRLSDADGDDIRAEESFFGSVYKSGRKNHPFLIIVGTTPDGKYQCLPYKEKQTGKLITFSLPDTIPYARLDIVKHVPYTELSMFRARFEELKSKITESNSEYKDTLKSKREELEREYGPMSRWDSVYRKVEIDFSNTGPSWKSITSIDTKGNRVGIQGSGTKQRFIKLNSVLGLKY